MAAQACDPSTQRLRQEDLKFQATLSYTMSTRGGQG
jgi:hypothetical protein